MARVLYLAYDGVSDPLGQSQILPYLRGLARLGHNIHLISFEKAARFVPVRAALTAAVKASGIEWHPMSYTKRPPVLSTVWDIQRLRRAVGKLQRAQLFDIVHCRSYLPSLVGLDLKRDHGVRFIFDMRGLWPDEKVEGGAWPLGNPVFRRVYTFFKGKEADFVAEADGIVTLTNAGRREVERWDAYKTNRQPVSVIPCTAEFDFFAVPAADARMRARTELNIAPDAFVVAYLGSLGTWYLLDEMLDWFTVLSRRHPAARFLFVTPDDHHLVRRAAAARGLDQARILIVASGRERIPHYLSAVDAGFFFIRPTYSKQGSSPTKLGEYLAMGIPVITNAGVGDGDEIIETLGAGILVPDFSPEAYSRSIDQLPVIAALDRAALSARARHVFELETGVAAYDRLYRAVLS
jgi:glycosyltransferase involved in cell wall biosynthesis